MSKDSDKQAIETLLEAGENYLLMLVHEIRTGDGSFRPPVRKRLIDAVEQVIQNVRTP